MNYFAHAVAASWVEASPAFLWGAMLPDLVGMLGTRIVSTASQQVARGVAFHHHTDRIFHEDATFSTLESTSRARLQALGVRKGARRALSHVGPELMLDGLLARSPQNVEAYRAALLEGALRPGVSLARLGDGAALRALVAALAARAGHPAPRTPDELVRRLERVLEPRPALRFDRDERSKVLTWAEETVPRVETLAEDWLRALKTKLAPAGSGA